MGRRACSVLLAETSEHCYLFEGVKYMPRLRFCAIPLEQVMAISKPLTEDLAQAIGCAREHFVLEHVSSTFVWDGDETQGFPYVDMHCFDRGEAAFDKMAEIITRHLKAAGCPSVDVVFRLLERRRYYENGTHLAG